MQKEQYPQKLSTDRQGSVMYEGQKIWDFHFFSLLLNTFNSDKCTEKIFCSLVKLTTIKCHNNPLDAAEVI